MKRVVVEVLGVLRYASASRANGTVGIAGNAAAVQWRFERIGRTCRGKAIMGCRNRQRESFQWLRARCLWRVLVRMSPVHRSGGDIEAATVADNPPFPLPAGAYAFNSKHTFPAPGDYPNVQIKNDTCQCVGGHKYTLVGPPATVNAYKRVAVKNLDVTTAAPTHPGDTAGSELRWPRWLPDPAPEFSFNCLTRSFRCRPLST